MHRHHPLWVAKDAEAPEQGVIGYLGFLHFMNERPGHFITADVALWLRPDYQGWELGTYLLGEAIRHAPSLGIEVLAVTIFASNLPSIGLFTRHGFEHWGFMPRVARLGPIERDLLRMGRRVDCEGEKCGNLMRHSGNARGPKSGRFVGPTRSAGPA